MAKLIKSSDIFEGDLLEVLIKEIKRAENKLEGLSDKISGLGSGLKKELEGLQIGDLQSINKILAKSKEIEESMKQQLKIEKEKQSLETKRITFEEKLDAVKKKNQQDEIARLEKIKGIQAKNYEEAYRDLLKNEAEIKRLDELKKKASSDELIRIEKERQAREKTATEQKANLLKISQEQAKADILSQKLVTDQAKESDRQKNQANKDADRLRREADRQRAEAKREADRLQREAEKESKRLERERKIAEDLANAYKQLEKNTRDLKNESKKLGAELLELERNGQQNTRAYRDLERQYQEVTKQAIAGDKALKKLDEQVGDNFRSVGNYEKATRFLKGALAELGLAFGAFEGVRYLIDSQVKLDSLSLSLKNVSDSTKEYTDNVSFLRGLSKDYGQDLLNLTETYKNFIASTDNSNLSIEERRRIYESIIKAGSSLALSNDDVAGTLRAVQQMFSKGTVQAEELRQQLGDRLPGAFSIMAESMGVTEEELGKLMKNGAVLADDVMPRFATKLEEAFGDNARARVNTLGGAWNNLKNEILLYFNEAQSGYDINKTLASTLNFVANNIKSIIGLLVSALKIWASYKLVVTSSALANKIFGDSFKDVIKEGNYLTASLNTLKRGVGGLKEAFTGLGSFLKQNVVGVFVLIATEIVSTQVKMKGILGRITEYKKELMQGREDVIRQTKEEKLYLDNMISSLRVTNYESNRRKEIIEELNSKYGTNIQNIKDEKTFLNQLNQAYETINETLDKKMKRDILRIRYETTQRQLSDARTAMDIAKQKVLQKELDLGIDVNRLKILKGTATFKDKMNAISNAMRNPAFALDAITDLAGANGWTELAQEFKNLESVYNSIQKVANQAQTDYEKLLKTTNNDGGGGGKKYGGDKPSKDIANSVQYVVELNTKFSETNEYISRQAELLKDIKVIEEQIASIQVEDTTNKILEAQRRSAEEKGLYDKSAVETAIEEEKNQKIAKSKAIWASKSEDAKIKAEADSKAEREKIEQELTKNKESIAKKYTKYKAQLDVAVSNDALDLTKRDDKRNKEKHKKLSKDEKEFLKAKKELYDNYDAEIKKADENKKKREDDAKLESLKEEKEHKARKLKIETDANNQLTTETEANDKAVAEYRLEQIKKMANMTNQIVETALNSYITNIENKINILDDRMNRIAQNSQYLQDKAVAGNIVAEESLAKAQADQLDAEKKKINYQRSIQRLQMAIAIFNAYNNNIQNAKVGENAFAKTITDVSQLSMFIQSIPKFYKGTETTVADALGKPQLSGKDGHIVRVDGSEKILNPYLSQKTGDLTTFEIAKIAEDRLKGKLVYNTEGNTANNMWASIKLIDEIQDLKSIIKSKPETNIAMGEIGGGVMKIGESTKVNNTTTRNIHRFNNKI